MQAQPKMERVYEEKQESQVGCGIHRLIKAIEDQIGEATAKGCEGIAEKRLFRVKMGFHFIPARVAISQLRPGKKKITVSCYRQFRFLRL